MTSPNGNSELKAQATRLGRALERLYAFWLVSTAVLLVLCLATGLYVHGAMRNQREALRALEARVGKLEIAPAAAARPAATGQRAGDRGAPGVPRPERPSPLTEEAPSPRDAGPDGPAPPSQPAPVRSSVLDDAAVRTALAAAVRERDGVIEVTDPAAVGALLSQLRDADPGVTLDTDSAFRLAIAARLVGRDAEADSHAGWLASDERAMDRYLEVSARSLLARNRPREALAVLEQWAARAPERPVALVLRALVEMTLGHTASAESAIDRVGDFNQLTVHDRVAAATLLAMLEHWPAFEALVAGLGDVPAELEPMRDLLGAILLWRTGRLVESLAALDFLGEHLRPAATAGVLSSAGAVQRPRRYDVDIWRGAALAAAGEWDAARNVLLASAQVEPTRPEAYVELGRIEVQAGRADRARSYLQNALTQSPSLPAAWEVLAVLSVNEGNVSRAVEEVSKAIAAQPARRSSLLLRAIAYAKLGEKDAAAADIRRLLALDPSAIEEVRSADAIVRLFGPEGLERLAAGDAGEPAPATVPAAPGP